MTEFELLRLTGGRVFVKEVTTMFLQAPLIFCTVFFHLQAAEKVDAESDERRLGRNPQLFRASDIGVIVRG